ncbi:transposase [Gammaproteobacteria bacterium]
MDYKTKNHSKFLIVYHIIFVVKYRKSLLVKYGDWMKQTMIQIAKESDFSIKEIEVDCDHIHLMIESEPKLSPLQIVRRLKQLSTTRIWAEFPELKKYFWRKHTFWSDGYFCCSIGNASIETVKHYIENQG